MQPGQHNRFPRRAIPGFLALLGVLAGAASLPFVPAAAQDDPFSALLGGFMGDLPSDPQALADQIVDDVVAIRGLELRQPISVENQSDEDFASYLDAAIDQSLPPERAAVFGRVVSKLGLYRGPNIDDIGELMKYVMTSQAAAYYDPDNSTFYVLIEDAPPLVTGTVYAHELYHGLQDQYFDLDAYLLDPVGAELNDDELLARQAVVEGEATYVMTLWSVRQLTGQVPSGLVLDLAVQMQSQLDVSALQDMLEGEAIRSVMGDDSDAMVAAMSEIPPFLIETLVGAYLKGMAFVHAIVKDDWNEADRLYSDPPRSTEQILHPEKWLERDDPVTISLPEAPLPRALAGWDLLDTNVIGEVQWRIIFNEHDLRRRSESLAAGWDGDRYAVLERDGSLLLLLYTTWDSEAEAAEFAAGYESLLGVKYPTREEPVAVEMRGRDVLIVEGGDRNRTADYLEAIASWPRQ